MADNFRTDLDQLLPQRRQRPLLHGIGQRQGNPPQCGDFVAWRHPTYGHYTPGELSYEFVNGHDGSYSRQVFNGFQCLIWLLCDESRWMPEELRETLKRGFRERVSWWVPGAKLGCRCNCKMRPC